jgi:hypothetical protein
MDALLAVMRVDKRYRDDASATCTLLCDERISP